MLISNAARTRYRTEPDSELVKSLRPVSPKRGMYSFDIPVGGVYRCSRQRHLMGAGSEPLTQARIVSQPDKSARPAEDVVRIDHETVVPVLDQVERRPTEGRGDHGQPRRRGFQDHDPEWIVKRRESEDIRLGVHGGQLGLIDEPSELDVGAEAYNPPRARAAAAPAGRCPRV